MRRRQYLFPNVLELNLQAARSFGVNIYLIDGGTEYALIDCGLDDTLDDVVDLLRDLDFPLSKCKCIVASHADADHVQGLARAKERLKTKVVAHPHAAHLLETGDAVQTYAKISAQNFEIAMPTVKVDHRIAEGEELTVGSVTLTAWHTPGHTPGQLALRMGNLLFGGDNLFADGSVGVIDAHHGSNLLDFISSLTRIRDCDAEFLLPSHGPVFRKKPALVQNAIDRLTKYTTLADFGTLAVNWPLMDTWEKQILSGEMPDPTAEPR
jgi:glyoxylase-like metal-dependent hydrolase (beta-lactamase superfamily II)